jgi:hypothetical protein
MFLLKLRAALALGAALAARLLVFTSCDTGNSSNLPGPGPLDDTAPVIDSVSRAEDDSVSGSVAITASASVDVAVLFSSSHTEGIAQTTLNDPDRVRQYLIFEVL